MRSLVLKRSTSPMHWDARPATRDFDGGAAPLAIHRMTPLPHLAAEHSRQSESTGILEQSVIGVYI